jgi:glucokinase
VRRAWEILEKPGTVSILREMAGEDKTGLTPATISEAAGKGDGVALNVLRETGRLLGVGIVSLVNIFAPETVILGGGVAAAGEVLFSAVREEVRRKAMPPVNERVQIIPAAMGNAAGVVGAAGLLLRR